MLEHLSLMVEPIQSDSSRAPSSTTMRDRTAIHAQAMRLIETPPKALLFLDIDGVLHPAAPHSEQFVNLHLLEEWLRDHPEVSVIFTSSWRLEYDMEVLCGLFSDDLQHRVIGATPDLGSCNSGHRGLEVLAWLQDNNAMMCPWLAIDDKPEWFNLELHDRLIVCQPELGLTEQQIQKLEGWIHSHEDPP